MPFPPARRRAPRRPSTPLLVALAVAATVCAPLPAQAVPAPATDSELAEAAAALTVWNATDVRGYLTLPTASLHGAAVQWGSSKPRTITPTGEVNRPTHGRPPLHVTLTATVRLDQHQVKRRFDVTVRPLPEQKPMEGYFFPYFAGERYTDGEQVYFGASRGNDPLHWDDLNDNNPVLTSSLGEKGVRDPFIVRSPERDKFYLVATDLKINGGKGWGYEMRFGSQYLEVWESTDLVHWSEQRHVKVSGDQAGMTWAPEATWDPKLGEYVVYWASNLYAADDTEHTGSTYPRMMYATTRDFHTFSKPKVWNDPGGGVIDSTVARDGGWYYRVTTDDKVVGSCARDVVLERSRVLTAVDTPDSTPRTWQLVDDCVRTGVGTDWVEGPTVFRDNSGDGWWVFMDEAGGRGYLPFHTDSLSEPDWSLPSDYQLPSRPRHGTVLPVTAEELARVRAAFPSS
ncbi:glycoside hydrolase family 43 protein [Streptomyces canus]|uniref:glycoside hydrolase family 43 protein n=1 Tax=Streptomyces canus TaxID=58343 RepID=UPI002E36E63E|nr:glycoside hydrolase family 43 protein [Streptomyces canus]